MLNIGKNKQPVLRFECAGGCGRFQLVRLKKTSPADYYLCHWTCGSQFPNKLPKRLPGQILSIEYNACGAFYGMTILWPDHEEKEALEQSRMAQLSCVARLIIEKAQGKQSNF